VLNDLPDEISTEPTSTPSPEETAITPEDPAEAAPDRRFTSPD